MLFRRSAAAALLLALAGCAAEVVPPPAPPRVTPAPPLPNPPPVAASSDWRDWPLTPGDWSYRRTGSSVAKFGTATAVSIELQCLASTRQIMIAVSRGSPGMMLTIRTSSAVRTLPTNILVREHVYPLEMSSTQLPASDPLFDAMGFSRGHFIVERPGAPPLVIPAWPEILRVAEDCRG